MKKIFIIILLTITTLSEYSVTAMNTDTVAKIVEDLTNIFKHASTIPVRWSDLKTISDKLNTKVKCFDAAGKGNCLTIGCESQSACLASILIDVKNALKHITDVIFGEIVQGPNGKALLPGFLISSLSILGQFPVIIPDKFKPNNVKDKIDALTSKVKSFNNLVTMIALRLTDTYVFLDWLENQLNPKGKTEHQVVMTE